ncbi:phosphonate C-P lyase system protein PhnH [Cryptosporangium sp. NPDC048952]|uniref:phosphonate C-P lyase system protein PhnH n=1 Tax=Cryptosporangium sp. NPDC048952 TaxID=3363961 RepID=UPI0037102A82
MTPDQAQQTFRAILEALSHPTRPIPLPDTPPTAPSAPPTDAAAAPPTDAAAAPPTDAAAAPPTDAAAASAPFFGGSAARPPAPLSAAAAAVAQTLCDEDTPVWLDRALAGSGAVAAWFAFHTGAPVVADHAEAAFVFATRFENLPPLAELAVGTAEEPHRSATVVLTTAAPTPTPEGPPAGLAPAGDAPAGLPSAGLAPSGDAPAGLSSAGLSSAGDAPPGLSSAGVASAGDALSGDARTEGVPPAGLRDAGHAGRNLAAESLGAAGRGHTMRATGPGIDGSAEFVVPGEFVEVWQRNVARFPMGVDFLFVQDTHITGLPRTTTLEGAA